MTLPLRLAVEAAVERVFQPSFILPSRNFDKLCFVISQREITAFATDIRYSLDQLVVLSGLTSDVLPLYSFIQAEQCWFDNFEQIPVQDHNIISSYQIGRIPEARSALVAKLVVEAINR